MFVTKISRLGAHLIKGLMTGKTWEASDTFVVERNVNVLPVLCCLLFQLHYRCAFLKGQTSTPRIPYSHLFHSRPWQHLNHQYFSSTAAEKAQEGGDEEEEKISVTFVDKDGEEMCIKVPIGMSMLEAAHENDIELEGACEGSLACSTCHVILMDMEYYNKLDDPTDEEYDMLDLDFGLTETSRLGCQVIAKRELNGLRLKLPSAIRNFVVDGFMPKPH